MTLYFGETLQRLRREKDLTQEALASFFGVTFQTVSKWERGETYPDITLLPELASFFDVSVDTLLGADEERREKKIKAYLDLYEQAHLKDESTLFEIFQKAEREFPGDFRILVRYMELLASEKDSVRQPDYEKTARELAAIYEKIRTYCKDDAIRSRAKRLFCTHLMKRFECTGDAESLTRAQALLDTTPALRDGREYLAMELAPDAGTHKATCEAALGELLFLLHDAMIRCCYYDPDYPVRFRIDAIETVDRLTLQLDPNGLFGKNGIHLIYNYGRLGHLYAQLGEVETAFRWLRAAAEAAKQFDECPDTAGIAARYYEREKRFREMDLRTRMKELMTVHYPLTDAFRAKPEFTEVIAILAS